jgi:hypothetical protein
LPFADIKLPCPGAAVNIVDDILQMDEIAPATLLTKEEFRISDGYVLIVVEK